MKMFENLFRNLIAFSIVVLNNESIFVDDVEVVAEETNTLRVIVSQDPLLTYIELALLFLIALSTLYLSYKVWKYFKEREEQQSKGEELKKAKLEKKRKHKRRK